MPLFKSAKPTRDNDLDGWLPSYAGAGLASVMLAASPTAAVTVSSSLIDAPANYAAANGKVGFAFFTAGFNPAASNELTQSFATKQMEVSLHERLDLLESRTAEEIRKLSHQVATLTDVVTGAQTHVAVTLGVFDAEDVATLGLMDQIGRAREEGALASFLDGIADASAREYPRDVLASVEELVRSEDPMIRAAAGRALSTICPSRARELLPEVIDAEGNKFVKAALRAAMRAAVDA